MKSPCKYPGCSALLDKIGYCERHQASAPKRGEHYQRWRRKDAKQSAIDSIRSTARWQRIRALKLSANPLCEDPFKSHRNTVTAQQVHHIKGLASNPELAFDWDNLMSVCARCHARLEVQARRLLSSSE